MSDTENLKTDPVHAYLSAIGTKGGRAGKGHPKNFARGPEYYARISRKGWRARRRRKLEAGAAARAALPQVQQQPPPIPPGSPGA
jgi:general stress protein YciG